MARFSPSLVQFVLLFSSEAKVFSFWRSNLSRYMTFSLRMSMRVLVGGSLVELFAWSLTLEYFSLNICCCSIMNIRVDSAALYACATVSLRVSSFSSPVALYET